MPYSLFTLITLEYTQDYTFSESLEIHSLIHPRVYIFIFIYIDD